MLGPRFTSMKPLEVNQSVTNYCLCGLWFSLMIIIFLGSNSWYVILTGVCYMLVFSYGIYATSFLNDVTLNNLQYESHVAPLNTFRWSLILLTMIIGVVVGIILSGSILVDVADGRCSNDNSGFVELYGNECTSSKEAYKECQEECIVQVRDHLAIESVAIAVFLSIGMVVVSNRTGSILESVNEYRDPLLRIEPESFNKVSGLEEPLLNANKAIDNFDENEDDDEI